MRTIAFMLLGMALGLAAGAAIAHIESTQAAPDHGYTAVDGDTIEKGGESIRLLGVDTPELDSHDCGSSEAKAETQKLLAEASSVKLVVDPTQDRTDMYDRALRYVELDGQDLGATLVREGYADPYVFDDDPSKRASVYFELADVATANDAGPAC